MNIKLEVPVSFMWVVAQMKKWNDERKSGSFKINFKQGGVCDIEKKEIEQPPKENREE